MLSSSIENRKPFDGNVPCNGCVRCCRGDAIRLLPGDDESRYQTVPHDWMKGHRMLDHKPNGDCVYLGERGCTIHEWKPRMCREMDCRNVATSLSFTQARKHGIVMVWQRGKELIKEAA